MIYQNYSDKITGNAVVAKKVVTLTPTKLTTLNLEVVFFNVTSCYVAEKCGPREACHFIKDYRPTHPNKILFYFKGRTLQVLDKARADAYGYGAPGALLHKRVFS